MTTTTTTRRRAKDTGSAKSNLPDQKYKKRGDPHKRVSAEGMTWGFALFASSICHACMYYVFVSIFMARGALSGQVGRSRRLQFKDSFTLLEFLNVCANK